MKVFIIYFLILFSAGLVAQTSVGDELGLDLLHREKRSSKTIQLGTKVVLGLGDEKIRGVLESVSETGLTIDGTDYPFRDITWIGVRTKWTSAMAVGLMVIGLGIGTAGAIYVASAGGLGFLSTALIVAGGAGLASLGIPLLRHGKRFYLDSDWKVIPQNLLSR